MVNEICDCCTETFNMDNVGIVKSGKTFCSIPCLQSYAIDHELARIAAALEGILERMGGRQ